MTVFWTYEKRRTRATLKLKWWLIFCFVVFGSIMVTLPLGIMGELRGLLMFIFLLGTAILIFESWKHIPILEKARKQSRITSEYSLGRGGEMHWEIKL